MTYKWGSQTVIGRRDKRTIEVIQIDLAPGLKLMDEIEELECEGGTRARPGSRKPSGTKELDAAVARLCAMIVTKAVSDPHRMRPRNVKEREADGRGGERAWIADAVAELIGQTQVEQGSINEEVTVPLLW